MSVAVPHPIGVARARGATPGAAARLLTPAAGIVAAVGLWAAISGLGLVAASLVPSPAATARRLAELLGEPALWSALGRTLRAWASGLLAACAIAVPAGMLLGHSDRAYRFVRVPIEALRPVPPVVVLPLALLVLGGGIAFEIVLVAQGVVWPLLIQTAYGVRTTDPVALDTARSFRLGAAWRTAYVRLPSAAPMIATGVRLAAATAFAITIVCELVGGVPGLGSLLVLAQSGDDVETVYAVTLVAGICGLAIAGLFGLLERRVLGWRRA
jgi:ABC-type nitrate/sulfonate/bicarbonate transport system permease component